MAILHIKFLHRCAALMLLLVVMALPIIVTLGIINNKQQEFSDIEDKRLELGRLQITKANISKISAEQTEVSEDVLNDVFFAKDTSQVSRARLQEVLKQFASQSQTQITNVSGTANTIENGQSWIGLRVSVIGRFEGIARFISTTERHSPMLFIRTARISGDPDLNRASTPDARLNATMEVFAPVAPDFEKRASFSQSGASQ